MTKIQQGLKPSKRKLATTTNKTKLTANQWQNTPQQNEFMYNWLDIDSPTFGNAYKSAIAAKYSANYSKQLASIGTKWITEYNKTAKWQFEHLEAKLISMIQSDTLDSRSPADTQVKAIEILGKLTGQLNDKGSTTNIVVQPILSGASIARHIDTLSPDSHVIDAEV